MALGDSNNGKTYENTYYSRTRFKDYDNKVNLGFQFKSGMLVADISKEKDGFQYESLINIFITTTKAKILLEKIKEFEQDIASGVADPSKGYGINAGMGETVSILALHTTPDGGKAVFIGKVDNSGSITKSYDYVFNNKDFHYGLNWGNIESMDVSKTYYNDLEYEMFKDTIQQFSDVSSGAVGYAVADITRYDTQRILNKMNPIYDKLGIERNSNRGGYNRNGSGSNDYFMNAPASSNHKNYDDMEEDLPFE